MSIHRRPVLPLVALLAVAACGQTGGDLGPSAAPASMEASADVVPAVVNSGSAGTDAEPDAAPDGEGYLPIQENDFLLAAAEPLSTFGIDVDGASYANVRRFLSEGRLPPADAVRIEELVNYFDYDYPDPRGAEPFHVVTQVSRAPWNPRHRLVHVGIQGRRVPADQLPPANLVFLVDVSGSMDAPDRLPLLREALGLLVDRLRPQDHVAVVVYAGAAGLVLPPTSGAERDRIHAALDGLEADGSTAGGEGLRLAYRVAREGFRPGASNRVILATDGDFNVGVSSDAELVRLVEEEREHGVFLTVLGVGRGNLQDAKMEQIADHGNGNYHYVDGIGEARRALVEEMGGTLHTIARDVKVQVEFNPAAVRAYRLIGYENRLLAAQDFNDDRRDAGELGAGHSVTALYEVVPVGAATPVAGTDPLRYQQTRTHPMAGASGELLTVKLRYQEPRGGTSRLVEGRVMDRDVAAEAVSPGFRFAAAVAEWGMLLRDSRHRGSASFDHAAALARGAVGDDPEGHRAEFVALVARSRELAGDRLVADRGTDDGAAWEEIRR